MKKYLISALIAAGTCTSTHAQKPNYNDPVNCRWNDGRPMNDRDCEFFRKMKAKDEAEEAAYKARVKAWDQQRKEEREAREKVLQDRRDAQKKEQEARHAAEQEKRRQQQEQWAAEEAREAREEARLAAKRKAATDAQKKLCGNDYQKPAIGQTIPRFEQCVAKLAAAGQINRVDGVVTTYQGRGYIVHAMNDKIISWQRY